MTVPLIARFDAILSDSQRLWDFEFTSSLNQSFYLLSHSMSLFIAEQTSDM